MRRGVLHSRLSQVKDFIHQSFSVKCNLSDLTYSTWSKRNFQKPLCVSARFDLKRSFVFLKSWTLSTSWGDWNAEIAGHKKNIAERIFSGFQNFQVPQLQKLNYGDGYSRSFLSQNFRLCRIIVYNLGNNFIFQVFRLSLNAFIFSASGKTHPPEFKAVFLLTIITNAFAALRYLTVPSLGVGELHWCLFDIFLCSFLFFLRSLDIIFPSLGFQYVVLSSSLHVWVVLYCASEEYIWNAICREVTLQYAVLWLCSLQYRSFYTPHSAALWEFHFETKIRQIFFF